MDTTPTLQDQKPTILVVDDTPDNLTLMTHLLRDLYRVRAAPSGEKALQLLASTATLPDLILLDIMMPGLNGYQVCERIKSDPKTRAIPVIFLTAMTSAEDERKGLALGAAAGLRDAIAESLHAAAPESVTSDVTPIRSANEQSRASLRGARVLLVEDNEMNQELATELLTGVGMVVVLAENGQKALDTLANDEGFDGVLMDCQMPVMDGYTATRAIRAQAKWAQLPVIAMTANAMSGDREKVLEAGMNDHIAKPLQVEQMFATLSKWIRPAVASNTQPTENNQPQATSATLPQWSAIAGLDSKSGLASTMDNTALYERMLKHFCRDNHSFVAAFTQSLANGADPTEPARMAHTLKGTAGMIGAFDIAGVAGELEQRCLNHAPPQEVNSGLQDVQRLLEPLVNALATCFPATTPADSQTRAEPDANQAMSSQQVQSIFSKLSTLLADNDTEAGAYLDELLDTSSGSSAAQVLTAIKLQVEAFDFDKATSLLREWEEAQ